MHWSHADHSEHEGKAENESGQFSCHNIWCSGQRRIYQSIWRWWENSHFSLCVTGLSGHQSVCPQWQCNVFLLLPGEMETSGESGTATVLVTAAKPLAINQTLVVLIKVLYWIYCLVLTVLYWVHCIDCLVLLILYWLYCIDHIVLTVFHWLYCIDCIVFVVLYWLYCIGCIALTVL